MSTKSELLKTLEKNKGTYISGQELASSLSVSRTAIWKAIKDLKSDGYSIDAVTNKGYALSEQNNILSEEGIRQWINPRYLDLNIITFKSLDSTNNEAKRIIMEGAEFGTVIFAEEQTSGKGRRGKSFVSPKGDSIYVSFILKPMIDVEDSLLITVGASVAVARAIKELGKIIDTQYDTKIKWVNDLYINDKKFCGILTEAVSDLESGEIQNLVLGIGIDINCDLSKYPKEIQEVVGSIEIPPGRRNTLAGLLTNEVLKVQEELSEYAADKTNKPDFMKDYRNQSMIIGKDIYIIKEDERIEAHAMDIDSHGGLIVKFKTGETDTLSTGEISIRLNSN